jgi:outer membrane lipoprotein-sorting protein
LLSGKIDARFENLGAEKISGITAGKYRAVFPDNENTQSFIWVDEASGMVLRTEMISTSPEGETTKVVTEINNFKLSAESALFEIPSGSRKVLLNEIRDIFSRERGEEE